MFMIGALIIAIAASAILIKTLVGYSAFSLGTKLTISLVIVVAWFAPVFIWGIRHFHLAGNSSVYTFVSNIGYYLFGTAFILLILVVLRDFVWFVVYDVLKWSKSASAAAFNPSLVPILNKANLITVIIALLLSFYGLWGALKEPALNEVRIATPKIEREFRALQLSDLHINRTTPVSKVKALVERVNALKPDVILLTGDIIDDRVGAVIPQMEALRQLDAPYGVQMVYGNHEFYSGLLPWQRKFSKMGFNLLFNNGLRLGETGIYVGGIPDAGTIKQNRFFKLNVRRALENRSVNDYVIFLSHTPNLDEKEIDDGRIDLLLSGHTHGGQIFPFHLLVQKANKYLAGMYDINGTSLYVSRGAGYWGPPMRLFAPSEITLFRLFPERLPLSD